MAFSTVIKAENMLSSILLQNFLSTKIRKTFTVVLAYLVNTRAHFTQRKRENNN